MSKPLPERLKRLDHELMTGIKDFDTLNSVHGETRVKIRVFRGEFTGFAAACKVGGYLQKMYGATPSDAFQKVARNVDHVLRGLENQRQRARQTVLA